jgi:hypothetical protein
MIGGFFLPKTLMPKAKRISPKKLTPRLSQRLPFTGSAIRPKSPKQIKIVPKISFLNFFSFLKFKELNLLTSIPIYLGTQVRREL